MKILFICKSNIGRSPAAVFFFNNHSKKHTAISAGIRDVKANERIIKDIPDAQNTIQDFMKYGLDLNNTERRQITKEMFDSTDKVYLLMEEGEKDIPEYIQKSSKVTYRPFKNGKYLVGEEREKLTEDIKQFAENVSEELDKREE